MNKEEGLLLQSFSQETPNLSIQALKSTLNKLSNAYTSMSEKSSNTTLVQKRRQAVEIGMKSLRNVWGAEDFSYNEEMILSSKETLQELLPSVKTQLSKAKTGSSQKTLLERRVTAIELAIESLDNRLT